MIVIRRATAADLGAVRALLSESRLPLDGVSDCIGDFLVAESDGTIVGSIGMERYGKYGLLRSAAVAPSEQGRGIGRSLVDALMRQATEQGVSEMYLLTTTAEDYFPSFGFAKVDRSALPSALDESEELRGACPASAIAMRKDLAPRG